MTFAGSWLLPHLLSPKAISKLVKPEEQTLGGWRTPEDFEEAYRIALETETFGRHARTVEARLGVSKIWQTEVCDKFAAENGYGPLVVGGNEEDETTNDQGTEKISRHLGFPIKIHASPHDKLVSMQSVQWISKRCYGNAPIEIEEQIQSHEVMTFFGGPPRNPILLHKIARNWGLLVDFDSRSD
jgi:hypothetical protein